MRGLVPEHPLLKRVEKIVGESTFSTQHRLKMLYSPHRFSRHRSWQNRGTMAEKMAVRKAHQLAFSAEQTRGNLDNEMSRSRQNPLTPLGDHIILCFQSYSIIVVRPTNGPFRRRELERQCHGRLGTFTILSTCTITLTLCVWSSAHLNLPGVNGSRSSKFWRRVAWTLGGLFAPEYLIVTAWTQNRTAKRISKMVEKAFGTQGGVAVI